MKNPLIPLLKSEQTIFSMQDLHLYWQVQDSAYLKTKAYRLAKNESLVRLAGGLYALDRDYNPLELANKLITPSYISLQTVLAQAGAIFQYDSTIYSIANRTFETEVNGQRFVYRTLKPRAFLASEGLIFQQSYTIATPERALLDYLYLNKDARIENLAPLDQEACLRLAPLYQNRQLTQRVQALFSPSC